MIWARPGRSGATLPAFFDELDERGGSIRAVSIDMSAGYENTIRAAVGGLLRPFPVVKLANEAVNAIPVRLISHRSFDPLVVLICARRDRHRPAVHYQRVRRVRSRQSAWACGRRRGQRERSLGLAFQPAARRRYPHL
jgi:transposase